MSSSPSAYLKVLQETRAHSKTRHFLRTPKTEVLGLPLERNMINDGSLRTYKRIMLMFVLKTCIGCRTLKEVSFRLFSR